MNRSVRTFTGLVLLFVSLLFLGASDLAAVDFIRGDANEDGDVSIADPHFLFSFLFRGGDFPGCMKVIDANDDGSANIVDGVVILNYLFAGGPVLAGPFPDPGPDATTDDLECDSYGGGTPLEDPAAKLIVLDSSAAGGSEPTASIVVAVSSSVPLGGYSGTVRVGGRAIKAIAYTQDLTGTLDVGYRIAQVTGDEVTFAFLGSFIHENWIPPGEETPALEVFACLQEGLPAGDYPMTVVAGELVDAEGGRSIAPELGGGMLQVLADLDETLDCEIGEPPPMPPERPEEVDVEYRLRNRTASGGDTVTIPFALEANSPVEGFRFSLDFDEENLQVTGVEQVYTKPDGSDWEFWDFTVNNANDTRGGLGVEEGYVAGEAVLSSEEDGFLPANESEEVLRFRVQVSAEPTSSCMQLRFEDGGLLDAEGAGQPVANAITTLGQTVSRANASRFQSTGGVVEINPGVQHPGELEAEFRLAGATGAPGSSVTLPFAIFANARTQGFSCSVDFDEEVLQATMVEQIHEKPDGSDWDFWISRIENSNDTPGNAGTDEGYVIAAAVFSFFQDYCGDVPANTEHEVLALHFVVNPDTTAAATEVRFLEGGRADGGSPPVENTLTAFGESVDPGLMSSFVFIDAVVNIAPDISVFIRGDANGDTAVDISDSRYTLNFLFLGGAAPACFDAADSNDDGKIDIADPIMTLGHLFLGRGDLPQPFPDEGEDPTEDAMGCRSPGV